jgi:undecaprenyl-diphosphatase
MDIYLSSAILGVVEGITEFLPISSTGHLIIVNEFVKFKNAGFERMFDIVIQLGAILAALLYFRDKLMPFKALKDVETRHNMLDIWFKCGVAIVPALILGKLFGNLIEEHMMNLYVVSTALVFGGIIIVAVESSQRKAEIESVGAMSYKMAIAIGLFQCLAMFFPGTSRSAATIIGAMMLGASRIAAAEFSFFLAIPTMMAASGYSLLKHGSKVSGEEWVALGVGFLTSFLVAWAVIAFLMKYIQTRDFKAFGYYRMALGIGIVAFFLLTNTRPGGHKAQHEGQAEPKAPQQLEQSVHGSQAEHREDGVTGR